jgi:predicted RNA-binding Zn ribbon-like protein
MAPRHALDHEHDVDLEAALDLLNTRELESGQLVDHLHEPRDAATWFVDHDLAHPTGARGWTGDDLELVRGVRDALREVVDSVVQGRRPDSAAVETVNEALEARRPARLELDASGLHVGHRHTTSPAADALGCVASSIVAEIATGRPDRFRICANDTCRWAFYDASPTGRRRWCDMRTCGNRAKAARHRERLKTAPAPGPTSTLGDRPGAAT